MPPVAEILFFQFKESARRMPSSIFPDFNKLIFCAYATFVCTLQLCVFYLFQTLIFFFNSHMPSSDFHSTYQPSYQGLVHTYATLLCMLLTVCMLHPHDTPLYAGVGKSSSSSLVGYFALLLIRRALDDDDDASCDM